MAGVLLRGTLDLLVLKALEAMGPLHGYGLARRLEQVTGERLRLNQGTIYPCLLGLVQRGWVKAQWGESENHRRAKFYAITPSGRRQLAEETKDWRESAAAVAAVLALPK